MGHHSNKYEEGILSDFIRYLRQNNYEITMRPSVKSYEKLNSKYDHDQTMVKFHFEMTKPSDDRIGQEIKMFVLTNIKGNKNER